MRIETFVRVRPAHLPLSCPFLTFEQNQRMVYHEVLVAGDLSQDDVNRATAQLGAFQVSRVQKDLPVFTPCQGLCPNMDLAPVRQERA